MAWCCEGRSWRLLGVGLGVGFGSAASVRGRLLGGCFVVDVGALDQQIEGLAPDDIPGQRHDLTGSLELFRELLRVATVCLLRGK